MIEFSVSSSARIMSEYVSDDTISGGASGLCATATAARREHAGVSRDTATPGGWTGATV